MWIRNVDSYGGDDLLYLNSEGKIPDVSIIKKGEKRNRPFQEAQKSKEDSDDDVPTPIGEAAED